MIKCRAWKVLSDERNCIAIGLGRPEIHRFEVRCFEQKLDKLSRYLNLNDRKRLSKSRYSKTFQLRFVSTKNCSWKNVQLKRKIFQIPVFWKKRINFGASKLKLPPLKVRRFCDKVGTFCPFDIFWKIQMLHCLSANDYGQHERSRKFHSPLHPDIMDLDKKLTTKDNQWLLKVS